MPKILNFILKLFVITSVLCALFLLIVRNFEGNYINATLLSFILSYILFLVGFLVTNWSFHRSLKLFMGVVFGGIFVRFLIIAAIIFVVLRYSSFDLKYFISVFVIFYLIYQFFEFRFFNEQIKKGSK
jgi:hypothetical protein